MEPDDNGEHELVLFTAIATGVDTGTEFSSDVGLDRLVGLVVVVNVEKVDKEEEENIICCIAEASFVPGTLTCANDLLEYDGGAGNADGR